MARGVRLFARMSAVFSVLCFSYRRSRSVGVHARAAHPRVEADRVVASGKLQRRHCGARAQSANDCITFTDTKTSLYVNRRSFEPTRPSWNFSVSTVSVVLSYTPPAILALLARRLCSKAGGGEVWNQTKTGACFLYPATSWSTTSGRDYCGSRMAAKST